ncbi:glycoside hydrolase family 2 TIM barrel-domain containing protein [Saccharothrix deserti]|uniref:glycoside hydrolase family 2 TIM barrel-domain containing protein n=1 Tax=Saccharothrix deserti TaxID=2593674 RepID=UPI001EE40AA3|nr:glycoside hydrolase family 2 TIM barrel-domain containing protein [Saccharothrix deserti]
MELNRRNFLELGAAGLGVAGLSTIGVTAANAAPTGPGTEVVVLTGTDADHTVDWDFQVTEGRNSGVWSRIPTPSNWECHGFGTYQWGWNLRPEEKGLYRRGFTPSVSWADKRVFVVFEGSMTDTEVRVNGTLAGPVHQGGFYRFRYDITSLLRLGQENLLEVTVSRDSTDDSVNNAERRGDYWNFSGIYRPVSIQAFPAARVDRIAVDAKADGTFRMDVHLDGVTAAGRVVGQLKRLDGTNVGNPFSSAVTPGAAVATLSTSVTSPRTWTAETPNLYRVDVQLTDASGTPLHAVTERFGFRTIEVRTGDGVYVNGVKVILKGTNRHTFWPTLGRASSPRLARMDILLMKEMNNNAVRMSHYPPDTFFLDLCDELGLYVIDELGGWQKKYDEGVGAPLVASMVTRDVNHPSILMWANGNEGGWNTALDDDYARYDIQRRPVIHPWATFSGINTDHYETYDSTRAILEASDIFMSTEFLHALYDGGGGAGLNDYWNLMGSGPRRAGGFIWAFVDEGLVRDDRDGAIDTTGNNAPDGVLGPFREKEASFHTIRDIWSPVQLANPDYYASTFPANFDGTVRVVNRYDFTNLRACRFTWQLVKHPSPGAASTESTVTKHGDVAGPDIAPGATGKVALGLPNGWQSADALRVTANGPDGKALWTWVWRIKKAADFAKRVVTPAPGAVQVAEDAGGVTMSARGTAITIDKTTGRLARVTRNGSAVSLANGPVPAAGEARLTGLTHTRDGRSHVVEATYSGDLDSVRWRLDPNGWLRLDYRYHRTGEHDLLGVSLDYPEEKALGLTWLGDGPYRVWKNRLRGVRHGVWSKEHNTTATGASGWEYPEFKGYHANTYWAALRTTEGTITIVAEDENLFLRLFTPDVGEDPRFATAPFPAGGISLLDGIPAMGNKFHAAETLGPESRKNVATGEYRRTVHFRFSE